MIWEEDSNGALKVIRTVRYSQSKTKKNLEIEAELKYPQRNMIISLTPGLLHRGLLLKIASWVTAKA